MAIRYGDRTRAGSRVSEWLNGLDTIFATPKTVQRSSVVTVTADVTAHTKGAWTELIASTSEDFDLLHFNLSNSSSGVATEGLMDIAVGAAGSEQIIINNVKSGQTSTINDFAGIRIRPDLWFPIFVPAGSRIAARAQNVTSSRNCSVVLSGCVTGKNVASSVDTYGANTGTSAGVVLTNSNTYYEITFSTSSPYQAIVVVPVSSSSNVGSGTVTATLGIGSSGNETDLFSGQFSFSSAEYSGYLFEQMPMIYWGYIPANSRLAVKLSTGASSRGVILYGVPFT